jgi:hypothetical protein
VHVTYCPLSHSHLVIDESTLEVELPYLRSCVKRNEAIDEIYVQVVIRSSIYSLTSPRV